MIQSLSSDFQSEIKAKQDALDVTQAHLRAATRELSEQRKQIQMWQGRCGELDTLAQRVKNVDRAIEDEVQFDWTGRGGEDEDAVAESKNSAFRYRGLASTLVGNQAPVITIETDPPLPAGDTVQSLVKLRRLKMWHDRMEEIMEQRMRGLRGASAEKEFMCRKIIALCTGVPVDKVEEVRAHPTPRSYELTCFSDVGELDLGCRERRPSNRHKSRLWFHAEGAHPTLSTSKCS